MTSLRDGRSAASSGQATEAFQQAITEAEELVRGASFVKTEQDLAEGLDYLAGSIRASLQMAWAYQPEHPFFVNSTSQHTKMGLDNPDTVYYHANLRPDTTYVVRGRRGTTLDLSFQVLGGDYTPSSTPDGSTAFDDREITMGPDGEFQIVFGPGDFDAAQSKGFDKLNHPELDHPDAHHVVLPETAAMLAVREVYGDWAGEQRGSLTIHRADTLGIPSATRPTMESVEKRYAVAAKMLIGRIKTWFAFPEWFYLNEPVNTLTEPRPTPGGLASQWSSVGHYDLSADEAIVITIPRGDAPYLGFQLGSVWYTSLDYIDHQTSLNHAQADVDPDGKIRIVVAEHDPGITNWVERLGHDRGYLQFRWQRLSRELTPEDGPTMEIVKDGDVRSVLPYYDHNMVTSDHRAARIAARQVGVANRMIG
jgi:hypothetical protein